MVKKEKKVNEEEEEILTDDSGNTVTDSLDKKVEDGETPSEEEEEVEKKKEEEDSEDEKPSEEEKEEALEEEKEEALKEEEKEEPEDVPASEDESKEEKEGEDDDIDEEPEEEKSDEPEEEIEEPEAEAPEEVPASEEESKEDDDIDEEPEEESDEPKEAVNSLLAEAKETMEDVSEQVSEDSNLPITRKEAIEMLMDFPQEPSDKNHYLESEAIMKALANYFEEDEGYWGMLGLLHDVDWHETKDDIENHTVKAEEILKDKGFDDEFVQLVQSHAYGYDDIPAHTDKERRKRIEFALTSAETLTGLIYAYALMRGGRVSDMKVKGLKKKFNDRAFAAGCSRDLILEIENVGIDLDVYFAMAIDAISDIRDEIGLE